MTVREFYEKTDSNYEEALGRLRKEERMAKYLGMFLSDDSFALLKDSMEKDDMETAFRAAHTLKGVCANLSLSRLFKLSSDLTEDLRNGRDIPHAKEAYPALAAFYEEVTAAIKELTTA